jgi:hypothetical protein
LAGLRDQHPSNALWTIRLTSEFFRQFTQPTLYPVFLDLREILAVHTGCAAVGFAAPVGKQQDVLAVHLVMQGVEAIRG